MINSCGTGKPTDFFLFLFSSLLPITQKNESYRSQAIIESGLLTTLVPRYKVNRFSLIFAPSWGLKFAKSD